MKTLRRRDIDRTTEQVFEILDKPYLVEDRGSLLKVHEQVEVASLAGSSSSHGPEYTGVASPVPEQSVEDGSPIRLDNLGDPESTAPTNLLKPGDIPESGLAPRAHGRVWDPGSPDEETAEAAGEVARSNDVRHRPEDGHRS